MWRWRRAPCYRACVCNRHSPRVDRFRMSIATYGQKGSPRWTPAAPATHSSSNEDYSPCSRNSLPPAIVASAGTRAPTAESSSAAFSARPRASHPGQRTEHPAQLTICARVRSHPSTSDTRPRSFILRLTRLSGTYAFLSSHTSGVDSRFLTPPKSTIRVLQALKRMCNGNDKKRRSSKHSR